MLEWICPKCRRTVDPGFTTCPFCAEAEAAQAAPATAPASEPATRPVRRVVVKRRVQVRRPPVWRPSFNWADMERGFRFGLGFVAALACAYFVLFIIAYAQDSAWVETLTRWLRRSLP